MTFLTGERNFKVKEIEVFEIMDSAVLIGNSKKKKNGESEAVLKSIKRSGK
jgi:hypothetical protein